jgi:hypothetical protein
VHGAHNPKYVAAAAAMVHFICITDNSPDVCVFPTSMHDTRFTSITCSYGEGLLLEASSLAILAWIKGDAKFRPNVEQSMQWVASKCKDGRFGSTQSTILALKVRISLVCVCSDACACLSCVRLRGEVLTPACRTHLGHYRVRLAQGLARGRGVGHGCQWRGGGQGPHRRRGARYTTMPHSRHARTRAHVHDTQLVSSTMIATK